MRLVPVTITEGKVIQLKPGKHSRLIKAIIEGFVPNYAQGSRILYAADTGVTCGFFDEESFREVGMEEVIHGKMPDVVLYQPVENRLFLIEAGLNHGHIDGERHGELAEMFNRCTAGLLYVSAFLTKSEFFPYVADISW